MLEQAVAKLPKPPEPPLDAQVWMGARWPKWIPGSATAWEMLSGGADAGRFSASRERFRRGLGAISRDLVDRRNQSPKQGEEALAEALITRWRVTAALEERPREALTVDRQALERLLQDADRALAALKAPESAPDHLRDAMELERVALSAVGVKLAQADIVEAPPPRSSRSTARLGTAAQVANGRRSPSRRHGVLGATLLVATCLFFANTWSHTTHRRQDRKDLTHYDNTVRVPEETGAAVFIHTANGQPFTEGAFQSLEAEAAATGYRVERLGDGEARFVGRSEL